MKLFFPFAFCLFLLNSAAFAQTAGPSPAERTVLETEARRFEFMTKSDTIALAPMLADDLVYMHSNGLTESKIQHLNAISTGRLHYNTMHREEAHVRLYGKIAITNGLLHAMGVLNGNPFDLHLRYTAVYQKQKHGWRLLNWQSTRI